MAEYVFGQLLGLELRLAERRERQLRREWWTARSGVLQGRTLGVMGTGSIGRHIAATGKAFSLRVTGLQPQRRAGRRVRTGLRGRRAGRISWRNPITWSACCQIRRRRGAC
jgi:phosphoglycerate dehydrogenase-like enzyme